MSKRQLVIEYDDNASLPTFNPPFRDGVVYSDEYFLVLKCDDKHYQDPDEWLLNLPEELQKSIVFRMDELQKISNSEISIPDRKK